MPRRIRYQVACSLDGYIADPRGGYDWIIADPDIDFAELMASFDTLLMGRKTYEIIKGAEAQYGDRKIVVVSRSMRPEEHPGIAIISDNVGENVRKLRDEPGKDIWLFGGGMLFRSLHELDLVDTVEPAIIPVLIGRGIPMYPDNDVRRSLTLKNWRLYEKTGTVLLEYEVDRRPEGIRFAAAGVGA